MTTPRKLPSRLHHTAYTTKDMEKTRVFHEEVIGLPLVATWSESDELFGKVRTYCHCFFGLADGGALAFFQFADKDDERTFSPPITETPFHRLHPGGPSCGPHVWAYPPRPHRDSGPCQQPPGGPGHRRRRPESRLRALPLSQHPGDLWWSAGPRAQQPPEPLGLLNRRRTPGHD
jgi:catechol 2,3-dioxygenase-like lactoylglutathione lyase family enzyme